MKLPMNHSHCSLFAFANYLSLRLRVDYRVLIAGCLLVSGAVLAQSTELTTAMEKTMADIERDTETLNRLRAEITEQRKPLAATLETLQKNVAEKRAKVESARLVRQQGEKAQAILVSEVAGLEEECRFIQTLFAEYGRAMDTRANVAESAWLKGRVQGGGEKLSEGEDFQGLAASIGRLAEVSEEWRARRMGGNRFEGVALDGEGIERKGRFAAFGPVAYFAAENDKLAGMAITQFGSSLPSVFDHFDASVLGSVAQMIDGAEAVVPLDVTAGDAIKIEEAKDSFGEHIKKGGFVIWPLLGVGLVAAVLAVWKLVALIRVKVSADEEIAAILEKVKTDDIATAEALTKQLPYPLSALMTEAVAHADAPRDHLEEIMHEHVLSTLPKLESHLGTLAVLGGVAPLLGLLGTVTGMIHTFQLVTLFGSGDAKLLSGGISEALVTTEFGLAIAIPVLLVHSFLARRSNGVIGALEQTAVTVVNDLKVRNAS